MPLYEIDEAATLRTLDTVTEESVRALDECAARAQEIDREVREAAGTVVRPRPPARVVEEDDDLSGRRWMS